MAVTVFEQILQPFLLALDEFPCLCLFLLRLMEPLSLLPPLRNVLGNDQVVGNLTAGVKEWADVAFDILVDAEIGIVHVLTEMHVFPVGRGDDIAEEGHVEHGDGLPETAGIRVTVHGAEFLHVVVQVCQEPVLVIERHGHQRQVGQCVVFLYQVAGGLVFIHLLGDVVDGVHHVGGVPVLPQLNDGMSLEVVPEEIPVCTGIPPFVEFEMALTPVDKCLRQLAELLALVGVDAVDELLQRHAFVGQDMSVVVGDPVIMDVILHDVEVAHVECLKHHLVQFPGVAGGTDDMPFGQAVQEVEHDGNQQDGDSDVESRVGSMLHLPLRMDPAILNRGNYTLLLQTGVLVVDLRHEFLVAAEDAVVGDGDACIDKGDALQVQFFDLPFQRLFSPDKVLVVAVEDTHQCHLGCLELDASGVDAVPLHQIDGSELTGFEDGALALQHFEGQPGRRVGQHGSPDAVVVDGVLRADILASLIPAYVGYDDIGIAPFEGFRGDAPLFHDEPDGYADLLGHGPHDVDIAAGGLSLVVEELVRSLVPVTDHYQGVLLVILLRQWRCRCSEE